MRATGTFPDLHDVVRCRVRAAKCRAMASSSRNENHSAHMLELAYVWEAIADSRERMLKMQIQLPSFFEDAAKGR